MKRYKLKKDLPTFNKGDEFYINSLGHLVKDRGDVVAYAARTLSKFPNILEDWFEEIKENARWRAKEGEIYWRYNEFYGEVFKETEHSDIADEYRYKIGNYFETEKEAKRYGEYLIALQTIKDDAKGFKPDWEYGCEAKYEVYYDHEGETLKYINVYHEQVGGAVYFRTEEDAEESLDKHEKEWLIVLGVEE